MIIVFTSFIFFFGFLIWYADRHNKTVEANEHRDENKSVAQHKGQMINFIDRENVLSKTPIHSKY